MGLKMIYLFERKREGMGKRETEEERERDVLTP